MSLSKKELQKCIPQQPITLLLTHVGDVEKKSLPLKSSFYHIRRSNIELLGHSEKFKRAHSHELIHQMIRDIVEVLLCTKTHLTPLFYNFFPPLKIIFLVPMYGSIFCRR